MEKRDNEHNLQPQNKLQWGGDRSILYPTKLYFCVLLQEKWHTKNVEMKELSKNLDDTHEAGNYKEWMVEDASISRLLTPPTGLKHTFSQLLGVLEADRFHLNAASTAENT